MRFNSAKVSLLAIAAATCLGISIDSAKAAIVINEAYGGGGNSGSVYTNDFVELYNNGLTAVDVSGFQIDYASATGTTFDAYNGTTDTSAYSTLIPASTPLLAAGGFFLIQEAKGTGGTTALPSPNLVDGTAIAMAGTAFQLQLLNTAGTVVDLLGVGPTAKTFEGAGAAPVLTNTTSAQRIVDGVDTNNNNLDFAAAAPTPGTTNIVPEPASFALFGLASLGAMLRRRTNVAK